MKKALLVYIVILFNFSCSSLGTIESNTGKSDLILNQKQYERFISYLNGKYYSYEFERNEYNKSPIAFAISKDGSKSLMLMCEDNIRTCDNGVYILQTISRFSKKLNEDLYIFALGKKIIWNNKKKNIRNISDFDSYLNSNNQIKKIKKNTKAKNQFFDIVFDVSETDKCDSDDC